MCSEGRSHRKCSYHIVIKWNNYKEANTNETIEKHWEEYKDFDNRNIAKFREWKQLKKIKHCEKYLVECMYSFSAFEEGPEDLTLIGAKCFAWTFETCSNGG